MISYVYLINIKQRIKFENTYKLVKTNSQSSWGFGTTCIQCFFVVFFSDSFMVNDMNLDVYANENIPYLSTDCVNDFIKYLV